MRTRQVIAYLVLVALLTSVYSLHGGLKSLYDTYPTEFRSYYIPSSAYMKVASLGQRNFLADLVFIWAIQFFDRYGLEVRDTYLFHTFDVTTDLDPLFAEAYVFGNLFLSLDKRWDLIYALSDKALAADPKSWIPAWDAGTYAFFHAKDYPAARRYFSIAFERNPSAKVVQRMMANAVKYAGDYDLALEYWKDIQRENEGLSDPQASYLIVAAKRNIYDLTIKIHLRDLKGALERYRVQRGNFPPNLDALVKTGYLRSVPLDPTGKPYLYDAKNGQVACQSPFKFKGRFAQW